MFAVIVTRLLVLVDRILLFDSAFENDANLQCFLSNVAARVSRSRLVEKVIRACCGAAEDQLF